jgi:hypothetical protein
MQNATYTKCNGNAVKAYLLVPSRGCSSLRGGSSFFYGNSSSLFSLGVLIGSGDDDVDDVSFFLRHVPCGFGLFMLGSSFSIGLGFLVLLFFGCFFLFYFS